jgi:uncharacterized membrane protein
MSSNRALAASALASFIGLLYASSASAEDAPPAKRPPQEKCYGIAKMGTNDCATASHDCSSSSKKDSDPADWLWVPKGTCAKIVGASTSGPGGK